MTAPFTNHPGRRRLNWTVGHFCSGSVGDQRGSQAAHGRCRDKAAVIRCSMGSVDPSARRAARSGAVVVLTGRACWLVALAQLEMDHLAALIVGDPELAMRRDDRDWLDQR